MKETFFKTPSGIIGAKIIPSGFNGNYYEIYEVSNPKNKVNISFGLGILYLGEAKVTASYSEYAGGWWVNYQVACHEVESCS